MTNKESGHSQAAKSIYVVKKSLGKGLKSCEGIWIADCNSHRDLECLIKDYPDAIFESFNNLEDAKKFWNNQHVIRKYPLNPLPSSSSSLNTNQNLVYSTKSNLLLPHQQELQEHIPSTLTLPNQCHQQERGIIIPSPFDASAGPSPQWSKQLQLKLTAMRTRTTRLTTTVPHPELALKIFKSAAKRQLFQFICNGVARGLDGSDILCLSVNECYNLVAEATRRGHDVALQYLLSHKKVVLSKDDVKAACCCAIAPKVINVWNDYLILKLGKDNVLQFVSKNGLVQFLEALYSCSHFNPVLSSIMKAVSICRERRAESDGTESEFDEMEDVLHRIYAANYRK